MRLNLKGLAGKFVQIPPPQSEHAQTLFGEINNEIPKSQVHMVGYIPQMLGGL